MDEEVEVTIGKILDQYQLLYHLPSNKIDPRDKCNKPKFNTIVICTTGNNQIWTNPTIQ